MKKKWNYLLVVMLALTCLFLPKQNANAQGVALNKPTVQSVKVLDGRIYVTAGNVDVNNTYKLEWEIYDGKTNRCVKSDVSYSTADTIWGISNRKIYYAKCRAVSYDSSYNMIYSDWSDAKYFISQPKVTSKSKDVKKDKITIKWKKIPGVKNYTVYVKKGNTKKWTKVKTTNGNKYVLKKFKGKAVNTFKSKYYFTIVANATVKGKKITSGKEEYFSAYSYYY